MIKQDVLMLLQASSCFRGDVCTLFPCACAETIADKFEQLEAQLASARNALEKIDAIAIAKKAGGAQRMQAVARAALSAPAPDLSPAPADGA